jgi:hypothetical protein
MSVLKSQVFFNRQIGHTNNMAIFEGVLETQLQIQIGKEKGKMRARKKIGRPSDLHKRLDK